MLCNSARKLPRMDSHARMSQTMQSSRHTTAFAPADGVSCISCAHGSPLTVRSRAKYTLCRQYRELHRRAQVPGWKLAPCPLTVACKWQSRWLHPCSSNVTLVTAVICSKLPSISYCKHAGQIRTLFGNVAISHALHTLTYTVVLIARKA